MAYSAEVYPHNKGIGWRMKKCIKAYPFIGATGTGTELLWKVTPVHCCIELCWIGDKMWHLSIKDGLFPPNFQLTNSAYMGTRQFLKRFSSALNSRRLYFVDKEQIFWLIWQKFLYSQSSLRSHFSVDTDVTS